MALNILATSSPQLNQPSLAGRYSSVINPEEVKQYKEAFGEEYGPLIYWGEMNKQRENDPQRLREQLEILGPYMKDVAREKQRLGMESNIFATQISFLWSYGRNDFPRCAT